MPESNIERLDPFDDDVMGELQDSSLRNDSPLPETGDTLGDALIIDDKFVEWYLKKVNHLQHEIHTIKTQAEAKLAEPRNKLQALEYRFGSAVEGHIRKKAQEEGKKTFHFWNGTCRLRSVAGGPVVKDLDAALQYAKERELHTMLSQPTIKAGEYKKYALQVLQETGELLPGVEIEEAHDSFSIAFKKES